MLIAVLASLSAIIYTASNAPAFANSVFFGERGAQTADQIQLWLNALTTVTHNGVNYVSKSSLVEYVLADSAESMVEEHQAFLALSTLLLPLR